jgi:N-acetylmuramoyl-L-alanine amidase
MDFQTLEPDLYCLMNKHYTPGRPGPIKYLVIHHNAGVNLSTADCYRIWQDREASAHYQVEVDGTIGQLVNDWDTAWHAGDAAANSYSIGIEHANVGGAAEDWPISQETITAGAHLVAALCHAYDLGKPGWFNNVFPHSYFYSTSCPHQLAGADRDQYMSLAEEFYFSMQAGNTPQAGKMTNFTENDRQLLRENNELLRVIRDQLTGPGSGYPGWPQTGGRTLVDTVAAIGANQGIDGCRDTKKAK